jgi:hypothetical protein
MYQIDVPTAASTRPASTAPGTAGWFTDGNPAGGQAATIVPAEWLNMVQAELANIVGATPTALSKSTSNQVLTALAAMLATPTGTMRNAKMTVAAASASGTFTADQVVVAAALNGFPYLLANFNQTVNLATTGAGGMDTGSAPASGFVALYAIYNPTTGSKSILATNATSAAAPTIYGGAAMPAGYTASALISVWPTNGSGQFITGNQFDRAIRFSAVNSFNTSTQTGTNTSFTVAGVPKNAKSVSGLIGLTNTNGSTGNTVSLFTDAQGSGGTSLQGYIGTASGALSCSVSDLQIGTPQTLYYTLNTNAGTVSFTLYVSGYTF